ncbi:MAG: MFS transporter [Candidatus Parcubacteria bacterium]|nr:MAG: MFS transporter [Candidatus Parcubacteria bacterium]
MNKKKILGVNKNVFYLSLVSLFNDFSSEMVYSIMPVFLTRVLGAPIWFVGFLEGFAEALNNILKIFSGRLADYLNRRKILAVFGYSISTLTRFFLYLVNNFWQILVLRVLDRVGKGLRDAPRDALIYLFSEKEQLNKLYNFHRAFDTIGAILGPIVGFILLNYFLQLNYRLLFLIASLLGFLTILTFIFVEDKKENYSKNKKFIFSLKIFPANLKLYLISFFLFSLGYFPLSFTLLRIQTIDSSLKTLPLFYFIFNFFFVIFAFPIGKLADKYGERLMLKLGFIFAILSFLIFSIPNNLLIFPAIVLLSLSLALIDGIKVVYLGKNIAQEYLATAQGTLNSLYGFGQLFGGLIGGLIWTKLNFTYAFIYGCFLILMSLILIDLALRK